MQFQVAPGDELPIYRQLVRQVVEAVAGGRLKPGDKLPSHRELGTSLVIAPLTVKKAYDELERSGYVKSERGRGTFVSDAPPQMAKPEREARLVEEVRQLASQAQRLGVSPEDLVRLVEREARRLAGSRRKSE